VPPVVDLATTLTGLLGALGGAALGAWLSPVVRLFRPSPVLDPTTQPAPAGEDAQPAQPAEGAQSAQPPMCPHCGADVPWPWWTPLPPLLLRGHHCPLCTRPLPRDPLVPVLLALVCAALAVRFGPGAELAAFAFFAAVAVPLAVIDVRTHRLPDPIVKASYLPAAVLLAIAALQRGPHPLIDAAIAMAGLLAVYAVLVLIGEWFSPGAMGYGDLKLSGLLGLFLGWTGLTSAVAAVWLWTVLAAVYGVVHAAVRWMLRDRSVSAGEAFRRARKLSTPLGPFMVGVSLAVICAGSLPAPWPGPG
jgi:leader peptidase (prepilin peptidase) / N-methyltransferase